jgi:predicted ATPase
VPSQLVPLVGRDAELQAIALARDAAADGKAGVLALVGDAGVGKSRLRRAWRSPGRTAT